MNIDDKLNLLFYEIQLIKNNSNNNINIDNNINNKILESKNELLNKNLIKSN